jgi:hypothetical protein
MTSPALLWKGGGWTIAALSKRAFGQCSLQERGPHTNKEGISDANVKTDTK